jgi:outer membrane protein assembly factor BamB
VSSPAICGRKLYFGCEDKKVYCLESETGKKLWDFKTDGTVSSPSISNGLMFVGSFDNKLYCFGVAK